MSFISTVPAVVAVALPELITRRAVICPEVERAAHGSEVNRFTTAISWIDVLDQYGCCIRTVALPELRARRDVIDTEVECIARGGQISDIDAVNARAMSFTSTVPASVPSLFQSS